MLNFNSLLSTLLSEVFSHLNEETETEPEKIVAKHIRDIKAAMGVSSTDASSDQPQSSQTKAEDFRLLNFNDRRIVKIALDRALDAASDKAKV